MGHSNVQQGLLANFTAEKKSSSAIPGDLSKLYKAAASSMEVSPDQHSEQIIKQILSGAATVVGGACRAVQRAQRSAWTRQGSVGPAPRHAKLAVNAGFAIAYFPIDTHVEEPVHS